MEEDLHVTWESVLGIRHMMGHFGVVFDYNGDDDDDDYNRHVIVRVL